MSGGDPGGANAIDKFKMFYPHERGWSLKIATEMKDTLVLPAWAGVILDFVHILSEFLRFTRMSGGDPIINISIIK